MLVCGGFAYLVVQVLRGPYQETTVWMYDEFRLEGSRSGPRSFEAEGALPRNIVVEALQDHVDSTTSPGKIIVTREPTGRRVELSAITWELATKMSPNKEHTKLENGGVLVDLYGDDFGNLRVRFVGQGYQSLSASASVRIHNTVNGKSLDLAPTPTWREVQKVLGPPRRKDHKRHYVAWGR
jgi:hypothetical protein